MRSTGSIGKIQTMMTLETSSKKPKREGIQGKNKIKEPQKKGKEPKPSQD
jgi:hypothetical protein